MLFPLQLIESAMWRFRWRSYIPMFLFTLSICIISAKANIGSEFSANRVKALKGLFSHWDLDMSGRIDITEAGRLCRASPSVREHKCVKQITKGLELLLFQDFMSGFANGLQDAKMSDKRFKDTIAFSMALPDLIDWDYEGCIRHYKRSIPEVPFFNGTVPRGHRWFIHQYLKVNDLVFYGGSPRGAEYFLYHYDSRLIAFGGRTVVPQPQPQP